MDDIFETEPEMVEILSSEATETEKLARAYRMILKKQVEFARGAVELARVSGDRDALVKEQIKMGALKSAAEMFTYAYQRVTGKRTRDA